MDYSKKPGQKIEKRDKLKNNEKPVISIITPFYNGGATLQETAFSVFNQTYPFFEWIIVDDGSKDKESLSKLNEVSKMDSRIKVFHKENGGPSMARDYGIMRSSDSSKYVFFLDCDDIIDKTMLECLYWTLETHSDASFAYTTMVNFGDREFIWNQYLTVEREKYENVICIASLVKKDDLLEVGCFGIKEKSMYEDWNLWLKLLQHGKKPIRVNAPLFWYRISNTGEFSRAKKNNESAMRYVNETASKIVNDVEVIQFPRLSSVNADSFVNEKLILPMYTKGKKKNILFLFPWMVIGGADIFNLELIKRLNSDKYDVHIVTTLPSDNPIRQSFSQYSSDIYDLSSFLDTKDYLSFVDYIVKSRNIDIIFVSNCAHGYAMLPFIKSKYPNVSVYDYVHSIDYNDPRGGFGRYSSDFDSYIDKTFSCNNFTTSQLKNDFNKSNVETIYIGTDTVRFDSKRFNKTELLSKYSLPSDKLIVSFIARLSEEKRPEMFVDIAYRLLKKRNDLYFLIVGDGPLYNSIKRKIGKMGLSNTVKLFGASNTPEELYSVSSVTINCSLLEGLALTSYESLAMSVPVISTSVGGQKELIDSSVGRIVELKCENEIDCYVNATLDVLNNLEELSNNARNKILNEYTYEIMSKKFDDIFSNSVVNKKNSSNVIFPLKVYEMFVDLLASQYNWCVSSYLEKYYNVLVGHDDNSKRSKIKIKFKYFGIKYNCLRELKIILNAYRFCSGFLKNLIVSFACLFKALFFCISSIFALFIIILKIIKKKVGV